MSRVRRLWSVFWVALALAIGQQAALLHDLAHATERLAQRKDSAPAPQTCDKCFLCAERSSAAGATMPALPVVGAIHAPAAVRLPHDAAIAPRLAFHSRAPPALL